MRQNTVRDAEHRLHLVFPANSTYSHHPPTPSTSAAAPISISPTVLAPAELFPEHSCNRVLVPGKLFTGLETHVTGAAYFCSVSTHCSQHSQPNNEDRRWW